MATIDIATEDSLLILTVTGSLTANHMLKIILEYYSNKIAKDIIWDLTNGSMNSISQESFRAIANTAKIAVKDGSRRGCKTVFVGNSDSEQASIRLYTIIAEMTGVPIKYNVFRTIEAARSWISQE